MAVEKSLQYLKDLSSGTTQNKICVSDNTTKERNQLRICCSSCKFIISPM
jgi:hypothetical protein